jgi:hypothetical protein
MQAMSELIKDSNLKFTALHTKVDDAMAEIRQTLDKIASPRTSSTTASASLHPRPEDPDGPAGHRDGNHGRRMGNYVPPPARGTRDPSASHASDKHGDDLFMECTEHFTPGPRVELPQFDGMHPRLWQSRCEEYFALWGTPNSLWITYASAHFEGAALKWLGAHRHACPETRWEDFCIALQARFGRNQHAYLLRQMFHISQVKTVAMYVEEFSVLMDQLSAYGHHPDPLYYVTRFMDGLK